MTSFEQPFCTAILDFTFFLLDSQEITEINTKTGYNAYEVYKFVIFCNFMKKKGKIQNYVKNNWFLARHT